MVVVRRRDADSEVVLARRYPPDCLHGSELLFVDVIVGDELVTPSEDDHSRADVNRQGNEDDDPHRAEEGGHAEGAPFW